jgi:hypothetical protein
MAGFVNGHQSNRIHIRPLFRPFPGISSATQALFALLGRHRRRGLWRNAFKDSTAGYQL